MCKLQLIVLDSSRIHFFSPIVTVCESKRGQLHGVFPKSKLRTERIHFKLLFDECGVKQIKLSCILIKL